MNITVLTRSDEIRRFIAEWSDLYSRSGNNLFQNPTWHRIWWDTIGPLAAWRPHVVAGHVDGSLVAVASLAVRRSRGLRTLEWAGVQAFDYPDILSAVDVDLTHFWKLIRSTGGYDVAHIRHVKGDGGSCLALRSLAQKRSYSDPVYDIDLSYASGEAWFATLSKRTRSNHVANLRQIAKRGPLRMEIINDPAEVPRLVALLVELKERWATSRGLQSDLSRPGAPEFMEQLGMQALREGNLHLSVVTCGERIMSIHFGFISQDGFYYYQPSYDPEFAKMSPGRLHLTMLVMWAIDNGYHRFDFLRGDDTYKTAIGTAARVLNTYTFARGPVGRMAMQLHAVRGRIRQRQQTLATANQQYGDADVRS